MARIGDERIEKFHDLWRVPVCTSMLWPWRIALVTVRDVKGLFFAIDSVRLECV